MPAPPSTLPGDPDHVVSTLTGVAKTGLGGYPGITYKSPWSNFKPSHAGPWKIGFSDNEAGLNGQDLLAGMNEVRAANPGLISSIVATTPATPNDVPTQIQQMRSLLQQHVDIIFAPLASPTALNAVIDEAAKQNVPVISIEGKSTDKFAVNLEANPVQMGYYGAAGLVRAMGKSGGNVLVVQAIPGLSANTNILAGAMRVLNACHVKVVSTLTGMFDPTVAKSQVLTFLASHPQPVDGVFQVAYMAPGIIGAFEQVGRKVPPVADIGASAGSMAYWRDNVSKGYVGTAVGNVPSAIGEYTMETGLAMLQGRGIKVTDVPFAPPVVTAASLNKWVSPEWTTATNSISNGPPGVLPLTQLIDSYFAKP